MKNFTRRIEKRFSILIILIIAGIGTMTACGNTTETTPINETSGKPGQFSPADDKQIDFDSLIYRYTSVATNPISEYAFTIEKSGIKLVIKKNDELIERLTVRLNGKQFAEITEIIKRSSIRKNENKAADNCEGGSIEELTFSKNNKQTLDGTIRNCDDTGSLTGKTDELRAKLKSFFAEAEALKYW